MCRQTAPSIDLRLISYDKDHLAPLLGTSGMAVALGSTFEDMPPSIQQQPLMQEQFLGICRNGHPAVLDGRMALDNFVSLPHVLFTLRWDSVGVIVP